MDKEIALKYVKRKRRNKRVAIISAVCSLALAVFIIIAFSIFSVDRFTITTLNDTELCLTLDKEEMTTKLTAPPLLKATDTQYSDIPEDIDEGVGSKNTEYYFAYSFYLGGQSTKESSINYNVALSLNKYSNGIEEAMRVMIIRNDNNPMIYSKPLENGEGKPIYTGEDHNEESKVDTGLTTKPFRNNKNIIVEAFEIKPGEFDKYTIVIWIDG